MTDTIQNSFEMIEANRELLLESIQELPEKQRRTAEIAALGNIASAAQVQGEPIPELPADPPSQESATTRTQPTPSASKGGFTPSGSRDSTGQYLHEIGQTALLKSEQERELAQKVEAGRAAQARYDSGERSAAAERDIRQAAHARDYFIRANLRLVVSIARRYPLPPSMDLLDLVQDGNLGLEHAVEKFDWRKGFKFSTYATFWIRQGIGRALDQKANLVKLPNERSAELRAALRAVSGEGDDLSDDMAEFHRLSTPTSLNYLVGEDGEQELGDLLPCPLPGPEEEALATSREAEVNKILEILNPRQKEMVEIRFGFKELESGKKSYKEIGSAYGVTAEMARRIVTNGVERLRIEQGVSLPEGVVVKY